MVAWNIKHLLPSGPGRPGEWVNPAAPSRRRRVPRHYRERRPAGQSRRVDAQGCVKVRVPHSLAPTRLPESALTVASVVCSSASGWCCVRGLGPDPTLTPPWWTPARGAPARWAPPLASCANSFRVTTRWCGAPLANGWLPAPDLSTHGDLGANRGVKSGRSLARTLAYPEFVGPDAPLTPAIFPGGTVFATSNEAVGFLDERGMTLIGSVSERRPVPHPQRGCEWTWQRSRDRRSGR